MITKFIDREEELALLERLWRRGGFQLVPVYGRRRVGKTELILRFMEGKKGVYFLSTAGTAKENIGRFKEASSGLADLSGTKDEWEAVLRHLREKVKGKAIVVIDEFPYLVESQKGVSSVFQAAIDLGFGDSDIFLVLSGSSMGMMQREVLSYRAPLYGRRTGQIHLKSMRFRDAARFFNRPLEEAIEMYAVCGGVPAYLSQFTGKGSVFDLIMENVLRKGSVLSEEVPFILRQEFRDPKVYMSILSAIALGHRNLGKIIDYTGLGDKTGITPYLRSLEYIEYVKREIPVTESQRSKKGLYFISDNFFRFWFRFVRPNLSLAESDPSGCMKEIKRGFGAHVGSIFEDICTDMLQLAAGRGAPTFGKVGRWWHKDEEIDIVGIDGKANRALFAECKWQDDVDGKRVLEELRRKAEKVDWKVGERKEHYAVFAKSFRRKDAEKDSLLFDVGDMKSLLAGRATNTSHGR